MEEPAAPTRLGRSIVGLQTTAAGLRGPPDFGDGAVQLLFAALVDSLIEDVRMLGKINLLLTDGAAGASADRYKEQRGKPPYKQVPYMFVAPDSRDAVGDLAAAVFAERLPRTSSLGRGSLDSGISSSGLLLLRCSVDEAGDTIGSGFEGVRKGAPPSGGNVDR